MYLRIPPLRIKITLESNPLKFTMLVGRLGVCPLRALPQEETVPTACLSRMVVGHVCVTWCMLYDI